MLALVQYARDVYNEQVKMIYLLQKCKTYIYK